MEALAAVLPTVTANANYTYNQYDTRITIIPGQPQIVISPHDQEDGSVTARVPLLDAAGIARWRAARLAAQAAGSDDVASEEDLLLAVARAYYGTVAAQETARAAERSKAAAEQNAKIVRARVDAGTATPLYANRAALEIARDDGVLIDARRAFLVSRRTLTTLSGLPEAETFTAPPPKKDAVEAEDAWQKRAEAGRAELVAAQRRLEVARLAQKASWLQYAPTVAAHGADRYSNASGFTGHEYTWNVGVTMDWLLLDLGTRAGETRKAKAEVLRATALLESTRASVRDDVHAAWLDLDAARSRLDAAALGADVAKQAADEMRTRFAAGTATQLDVIQTDRDLLSAEVERIRAEADLAVARLSLQRAVGDPLR